MYLKSIELQGFKSFPDKTVVHLSSGISAIVGPNGSGKSNIVDAIRWVLGEQSAKTLRGSKMEDVIFGGTKKRTAQGFCEISLTLDNTERALDLDFSEITVTRRYYRSGESEFFLNRRAVRLKDVHELFMDTGLGRDGYSIIGQGRIDEILSVRSADRREIFEEAAGISKYRYRKEESERKLASTEENLVRIRDIVAELAAQVEPLREQAEKAKSFLLLRDELRMLEVSVWLGTLERLKDDLARVSVDYGNAERLLSAHRREQEELYARVEALTAEMHEREREIERVREEIRAIEAREAEAAGSIAVARANLQNNEENISLRERELLEHGERIDGLLAQREARRARLAELDRTIAESAAQSEQLLAQARAAAEASGSLSTRIDGLRSQLFAKEQEKNAAHSAHAALAASEQELNARGGALASETEETRARLAAEEQAAGEIDRSIAEHEEKRDSAQNMLRGFELRGEKREKKVSELALGLDVTEREYAAKSDRLSLLRALEREYEGFSGSVRRVMQAAEKGALRGLHGPVSRLIAVDDRYSVAIEIALGASMQNIVVDSENAAKAAIGYLKSNDAGRATFLPLTAVRLRRGDRRELAHEPGFQGWGDELARAEARYGDLLGSLLGNTAVVDHIDSAIALAKKTGYAFRIVTLDGQLIQSSGAMTGGSLNKNVGILSRANELKRLEGELTELEARRNTQTHALAEAKRELEAAQYEAGVARGELRAAQDALLASGAQKQQHEALVRALRERQAELRRESDALAGRKEALAAQLAENERDAQKIEQEMEALRGQITAQAQGMEQKESERGTLADRLAALRETLASVRSERESLSATLAQGDELIASLSGDRAAKEAAAAALTQKSCELRAQIERLDEDRAELAATAAEKRVLLGAMTEEKLRIEGARQKCDTQSKNKGGELLNLERERSRLENKKTQLGMEEQQLIDRLWESYELTRATAAEVRIELESVPAANRRIGELRGAMKKLGTVNLAAIEEYAKVSERYEFLSTQQKDLEKAKESLLRVIRDLTGSMETLFAEQFALINESFASTFIDIFGGGKASLRLEDESDILNCGIEIRVELPGKAQRAISLLSGGEKAFVAIALYFAIIKVRPTPFVVLDEIEAALDDVNVSRYIAYIRGLCAQTQFILITHRRGTMEGSDILYGVTMQEEGVSKLLALNLSEVEEKIKLKPN